MTKTELPEEPTVSWLSGVYLPVIYKGHQIVVQNAAWTSRETIYVDDEVVHTAKSWKLVTDNKITVAGDELDVKFGYIHRMSAINLEIRHGDQLVAESSYSFGGLGWRGLVGSALIGALIGFLISYYGLLGFLISYYDIV